MYCSVGVVECCIVDHSNGIVECIVVVLVVIVVVHQTEVLERQYDVLTSLRHFSSRGSRNGSCVDCGLNEYSMDRIGDSYLAVDERRGFVTSSFGDMFDDVIS